MKDYRNFNNDTVFLIKSSSFEHERIKAALEDAKIPFVERFDKKERSSEVITGKNEAIVNIYVRYDKLDQAIELLIGIGAIKIDGDLEKENIIEEMSSNKRTLIKIISIIIFILIIWFIIYGVDFVVGTIKGLC